MKKILFLIHDLGQGGAEKVLVNLVNHLDKKKYDVSVTALFGGGVNEQFLKQDVHFYTIFPKIIPANTKWSKLFSPEQLYKYCIREKYDIVVSYLEGLSARVVSGCKDKNIKLISWIHVEQHTKKKAAYAFRSFSEAKKCYSRFDKIVCVSQSVKNIFQQLFPEILTVDVLYNTVESNQILCLAKEPLTEVNMSKDTINICGVGSLKAAKGFDRLIRIHHKLLCDGIPVHTYILGKGPDKEKLHALATKLKVSDSVTFLGYHTNPYKFIAASDLFVCSSYQEGFSTAATEALIVGTPVCTVDVSGMKEMLGDNEFGLITENSEVGLYLGLKRLLKDKKLFDFYKKQALIRGQKFSTEQTVKAVENMLDLLVGTKY